MDQHDDEPYLGDMVVLVNSLTPDQATADAAAASWPP